MLLRTTAPLRQTCVSAFRSPKLPARRPFASTMAASQHWLVVIPDHDGALEKRKAAREEHLKGVAPQVQAGNVVLGGATLEGPAQEGQPLQMNGSAMVMKSESREKLLEVLRNDIYTTSGIWDIEKAQIWPMIMAVKSPN